MTDYLVNNKYDNIVHSTVSMGGKTVVGSGCLIGEGTSIGERSTFKRTVVGERSSFGLRCHYLCRLLCLSLHRGAEAPTDRPTWRCLTCLLSLRIWPVRNRRSPTHPLPTPKK